MAAKLDRLLKKARALRDKGKLERALKHYRSACAEAASSAEVWSERAEVAERAGETEEAIDALYRAADVCANSGEDEEAVRLAERVLALDPEHEGARGIARRRGEEPEVEESGAEPETETEAEADAETEAETETETETEADHERDSERRAEAATAEPEPEAEPEAEADAEPGAEADGEADGEAEVEPEPGAVVEAIESPAASGKLALSEISLMGGDGEEPAALPLDIPEPGGRSVRAATAAVEGSSRLCELDSDLVARFIDCGTLAYRRADKAVFMQGEVGDSLFLVLQGELAVERSGARGAVERVATLRSGAMFGEMSLLTELPRSATVRAVRNSTLIEVNRDAVRRLITEDERLLVLLLRFYRARLVGNLMASSPLFSSLDEEEREDLLAKFQLREYPEGYVISRAGARSEGLYLVLAGDLAAVAPEADGAEVLGRLGPGDVFGETSLLSGEAVSESVRAESPAWVLELAGDVFRALAEAHPEVKGRLAEMTAERPHADRAPGERALAAVRPV